jgi:hypothetical protein
MILVLEAVSEREPDCRVVRDVPSSLTIPLGMMVVRSVPRLVTLVVRETFCCGAILLVRNLELDELDIVFFVVVLFVHKVVIGMSFLEVIYEITRRDPETSQMMSAGYGRWMLLFCR